VQPRTAPGLDDSEIDLPGAPRRLPLAVAALVIGALSAALWAGLVQVASALF